MTGLTDAPDWSGTSDDPNDEQFGDVVEPATLDEVGEYDAALVGEPYDGAVIGRQGAREGPAALREELSGVKTHHLAAGPVRRLADLGDVSIIDEDPATVQDTVADLAADVYGTGTVPVFLGGDNSLTYANAAPLLERGSVGAISFDAHLDCREVRDGPTSGTPYRQLHEDGLDAFAVVGAHHFETSTPYVEYVRERGGLIVPPEDVSDDPIEAAESALRAMAGVDAVYVSVDLDVLDAAAAPGVSAPTPGGVATRDLFAMVRHATADDRVAGFEVVECAPPLEDGNLTAAAGARTVAHALAGLEVAR